MAGRTNTSNTNPPEEFNDGNKYQVSKISSFQKDGGFGGRSKTNNTAYTTTRVSLESIDEKTGQKYYKREVVMFENKQDMLAFKEIPASTKGLGANGMGITIATGSTDPSKKSFELTEKGAAISYVKEKENKIQAYSSNGVKDIIKDENYKIKGSLNNFSNNQRANSKDDSIDAKNKKEDLAKKQAEENSAMGRKEYSHMFYPAFIQSSDQDKFVIRILKKKTNTGAGTNQNNAEKVKYGQGGLTLGATTYRAGGYKAPKNTRGGGAKNNRIYAQGENTKSPEYGVQSIGSITLPIPNGVSDQNAVSFGQGTLNPVQKAISQTALKTILSGVGEGGKTAGEIFKKTVTDPNTKKALAGFIAGTASGIDPNELLARTEGTIFNNNLALLFKSPTLRPFTFQFNLSPRGREEAVQVQKIIRALKQSSAVQKTKGEIFLAAPNTYELQFVDGRTKSTHSFLPRMKQCALLSVGVNYIPDNSYMTYEDSSMVAYSLSLSFQELTPIFNSDYDDLDVNESGAFLGRGPLSLETLDADRGLSESNVSAGAGGIGF